MSELALRRWLIFWELFIGLGAVVGVVMMFIEPLGGDMFGMSPLLEMMQVMPLADIFFRTLIWPAIALFVIIGIPNFTAFYMHMAGHRLAPVADVVCGICLMLWICVQFVVFTFNAMSAAYFMFGAAQTLTAYLYLRAVKSGSL